MPANEITREEFDEALHTIFVSYSPADLDAAYKAKLKAGAYADQEAAKFDVVDTGFVDALERMGEMQAELDEALEQVQVERTTTRSLIKRCDKAEADSRTLRTDLGAMEARALRAECVGCCCHMDGFNDCATCRPKRARLTALASRAKGAELKGQE